MEFLGGEALIFTKIFPRGTHISWKSSGVNILFNLQGVENRSKSATEKGEGGGGGAVRLIILKFMQ